MRQGHRLKSGCGGAERCGAVPLRGGRAHGEENAVGRVPTQRCGQPGICGPNESETSQEGRVESYKIITFSEHYSPALTCLTISVTRRKRRRREALAGAQRGRTTSPPTKAPGSIPSQGPSKKQ